MGMRINICTKDVVIIPSRRKADEPSDEMSNLTDSEQQQAKPTKASKKVPLEQPEVTQESSTVRKKAAATKPNQTASSQMPPSKQVVFDSNEDRFTVAEQAIADPAVLALLINNLSGSERRVRQFSAGAVAVVSEKDPELLAQYIAQISDALHRPEAQTRWECLEALARIVAMDPDAADDAISGAEASLYDEENGPARLGAVRFLAAYGSLDAKRSSRVWPYLDEAIQVYHGDLEFQDMLIAIIGFASGRLAKPVREALIARMRFDSENAKGPLQRRAAQIIELCTK